MTPQYVADRVSTAMLRGEAQVLMPWTVHLSEVVHGLLPLAAWDFVAGRVIGVHDSMRDFTGRR